ncbi:AraC family transcriptional regulator [Geodermatophilus sabuli]|uniref:Transcriptional regulator, AraC family n=1 Tax=Geodermatophilus sabuli TaxID=1564158 RepID=A0A285EJY5_9ACTN|nr:AraC family transcriptional regulator [Geodermatophilus sabuli]MBB3086025.1 AraC-like DNA-binding protein [Geodermatophilus sabuli]SNX98366.1 transcriptional regulator, AraC family [Geodermatophilus sabuli]
MKRLVRYATLTGYADVARACGLDPARLMASVGLDIADLAATDKWIPGAPVARLLELSARESGCEDFAVRMAAMRTLSTVGPLSVVLREEPDLRSALELLTRYEHVFIGVLDLRMAEADGLATVQAWLDFGEPVLLRQSLDLTAASLVGIIRMLVGADWQPLSVCFAHRPPADARTFHRVFGPGLRFEHECTGVVFPAADLDRPTVTPDPGLQPYREMLLQSIASPRPQTTADQVRALVELALPLGQCSMARISHTLGEQPRTLHRHLAGGGESFTTIVHGTRARLAVRYLSNDRYTLTDVSQLLGFAAPSTFSNWFRQQFGTTASEWRSRAQVGNGIGARA